MERSRRERSRRRRSSRRGDAHVAVAASGRSRTRRASRGDASVAVAGVTLQLEMPLQAQDAGPAGAVLLQAAVVLRVLSEAPGCSRSCEAQGPGCCCSTKAQEHPSCSPYLWCVSATSSQCFQFPPVPHQ